jgi:transposase-like protein
MHQDSHSIPANPNKQSKEAAAFTSESEDNQELKKVRSELDETRKQLSSMSTLLASLVSKHPATPTPPNNF